MIKFYKFCNKILKIYKISKLKVMLFNTNFLENFKILKKLTS